MNKQSELAILYGIILAVLIIIPVVFFTANSLMIIFIMFLVLFSRATPLYDNMKIEFHSILVLVSASTFGVFPGIYISLASALFRNTIGKYMGSVQKPPWILLDCMYLSILSLIGASIPQNQLFFYGFWAIVLFGNVIMGAIRVVFFMDPLTRRIPLSVINIIANYLIMNNYLYAIIAFVKG